MTLSEAFSMYAKDVIAFRNQSRKTEEHHNLTLKSLVNYLGDIDMSLFTFNEIRDWKISLEKRRLAPETIRGYLVRLRVVLAYLQVKGLTALNPELVVLPRREQRTPQVITALEVSKLINATPKLRNKAIISLLYSSGIRVSELCALDRRDVQESSFTVFGKGSKSRLCFIDARSREFIDKYLALRKDDNHALFIEDIYKTRIIPGNVQEMFRYVRRAAGFDYPIHPHTLRHSFATSLMRNGIHIYTLSRLMGHASIQTTQAYLHLADPILEEEYKKYHTI